MHVRRAVLVACLLALLAGCAGRDAGREAVSTTAPESSVVTEPTTTTTTAPPTDPAADKARAEAIVLKPGDFPRGWTRADTADSGDTDFDEKLERCLGLPQREDPPSAESGFTMGDRLQVSSAAEIVASRDIAERDFEVVSGPKLAGCFQQLFEELFSGEAGQGVSTETRVDDLDFPSLAERSLARRMTFTARAGTESFSVVADIVLAMKERVEMTLAFISTGQPFPRDLAVRLARAMVARA